MTAPVNLDRSPALTILEWFRATNRGHGMSHSRKVLLVGTAVLFLAIPCTLPGQQQPEPKPPRLEVTPLIGYRSAVNFPVQAVSNRNVTVDASPNFGMSFGVRLRDYDDLVETRWARQDSYFHSDQIVPQVSRQRVVIDQFHVDFSHEYLLGDWGDLAKPFVMASLGATHVSSSASSFTRFSFGIGGGVRFYASQHVYFKIQAEWLPIVVDPNVAFVCGGGCIVRLAATVASQGEVVMGPTFRF